MNFTGVSPKTVFGKLLRFPLRFIPNEMVLPILQGQLKGKKWIVGSSDHGCWLGSYEYEKRRIFEKTIAANCIVFDIGAHVGFYTCLASVLVGVNGRVFSFEPLPRNQYYLKRHLGLNRIFNATVVEAAVADRNGTAFFCVTPNSLEGFISAQGEITVETVGLDELISQGAIPPPDYVKIDVEGAEYLVLTGAKGMLEQSHPTIFLATHGKEVHMRCCDLLRSLGYHLRPIGSGSLEETDEILAFWRKETNEKGLIG